MTTEQIMQQTETGAIPMSLMMAGEAIEITDADEPGLPVAATKDRAYFRTEIRLRWNKARESVLEVGRLIIEAKMTLPKEEYGKFINNDLPFDYSVIQKLKRLAESQRINDPKNRSLLPHSWNTLHEIMQLPEEVFQRGVAQGIIHENCQWKDVKSLRPPPTPYGTGDDRSRSTKAIKPSSDPTVDDSDAVFEARLGVAPHWPLDELAAPSSQSKNQLRIILNDQSANENADELAKLKDELQRLLVKYPFIQGLELEIN